MRSPPKLKRREAEEITAEARSWKCESCPNMIEEGQEGPHCRMCAMYWADVSAGMFEERWEESA